MKNVEFINNILKFAPRENQRTGQFLFNILPEGAQDVVRAKTFDPFYRDFDSYALTQWVENHLVFGKTVNGTDDVIAVFNNNELLWEASKIKENI